MERGRTDCPFGVKVRRCVYCLADFESRYPTQRYCGLRCRGAHSQEMIEDTIDKAGVAARTAEVRAGWDAATEQQRRGGPAKPWLPPGI